MRIPPSLHQRLQRTLLRCGPFDSDRALRPLFVDARLSPWRDWLPEASSPGERVLAVIEILSERRNSQGERALVLFLRVLRDNSPPGDACRHELAALADETAAALRQAQVSADAAPQDGGRPAGGDVSVGGDVHGDIVTGEKSTVFDQRGQVQQQTNVAGDYVDRRQGATYVTHIERAEGIAIGDGAHVVRREDSDDAG
jgi:hypothetical protein